MPNVDQPFPTRTPHPQAQSVLFRQLRQSGNYVIEAVAAQVGLTTQQWEGVEACIGNLSVADYERIAAVFDPDTSRGLRTHLLMNGGYAPD